MKPVYKRILLKLSGEALMGRQNYGIDTAVAESVAGEIRTVHDLGVEIAIVMGGGNIFRGVSESAGNMDRPAADCKGMLATVMNAVVLQDALEKQNVYTRVMSAIHIPAAMRIIDFMWVFSDSDGKGRSGLRPRPTWAGTDARSTRSCQRRRRAIPGRAILLGHEGAPAV